MSPRKVCENCNGEDYTDMGTSACTVCLGTGVTTPEMLAALVAYPELVRLAREVILCLRDEDDTFDLKYEARKILAGLDPQAVMP